MNHHKNHYKNHHTNRHKGRPTIPNCLGFFSIIRIILRIIIKNFIRIITRIIIRISVIMKFLFPFQERRGVVGESVLGLEEVQLQFSHYNVAHCLAHCNAHCSEGCTHTTHYNRPRPHSQLKG